MTIGTVLVSGLCVMVRVQLNDGTCTALPGISPSLRPPSRSRGLHKRTPQSQLKSWLWLRIGHRQQIVVSFIIIRKTLPSILLTFLPGSDVHIKYVSVMPPASSLFWDDSFRCFSSGKQPWDGGSFLWSPSGCLWVIAFEVKGL